MKVELMTPKTGVSFAAALKAGGFELVSINGKAGKAAEPAPKAKPAPVYRGCSCPYCKAGERCGFLNMR
jgi:hypothetical protein